MTQPLPRAWIDNFGPPQTQADNGAPLDPQTLWSFQGSGKPVLTVDTSVSPPRLVLTFPGAGGSDFAPPGLRLSLQTGVPVTTADVTGAGTLYWTPQQSGTCSLYDGTQWVPRATGEVSLVLSSLTSGKNYDVFAVYVNGTGVVLELSAAWTNDTTRADALARQDGVLVKSADHKRLFIGTIRTTGTTTTEDSAANRFVWNAYNQVPRLMFAHESTASWSYSTATWRAANGNASNSVSYVTGDAASVVRANVLACMNSSVGFDQVVGVGVDSTSANSANVNNIVGGVNALQAGTALYRGYPGLGRHTLTWLEYSGGAQMTVFDHGGGYFQSGISAELLA